MATRKVTDLTIKLQSGTDNTYYATWNFDGSYKQTTSSSNGIKVGDLVSIKSGSKYYNGVDIPDWVEADQWYVDQITNGDRAVLGKNKNGTNNICSPVSTANLIGGTTTTTTKTIETLSHYSFRWFYDTGDGIWFPAADVSNTQNKFSTYSPPENAVRIQIHVNPVSKTYKDGGNNKSYWTWQVASKILTLPVEPPEDPPAPSLKIDKYKLTASLTDLDDVTKNPVTDPRTDQIEFELYNGDKKTGNSVIVTVQTQRASYTWDVKAGGKYRVRCRAIYLYNKTKIYSEKWSNFSSEITTIPTAVTNVKCGADSETSVKITWDAVSTATSYEVQYTTDQKYFDTSKEVQSDNVETTTSYITGLESGRKWYFRVRAKNAQGEAAWSTVVSTVIGTKPEPPTTWALTTTAIVGDEVTLYWSHNSEDSSKMTKAEIQLDINGKVSTIEVPGVTDDEDEPVYSLTFDPESYGDCNEGAEILWKVRTYGIVTAPSEWSTQRTINLYAPPTLVATLSVAEGVLTSLPLTVSLSAGPTTQRPTSYHIAIIAKESYDSVDSVGSGVRITAGTELYSKIFSVSDRELTLELSAGDVVLESGQSYDLTAVVSMDSGLTANTVASFTVDWDTYAYYPDAGIAIDRDSLIAYITPYCQDDEGNYVEDVTLSVYRREFNGTFTEIATDIPNTGAYTVTDPHPSLDFARYRLVAIHSETGSISFEDLPGQEVGETAIIIQWDEEYTNFDYVNDSIPITPPWSGSLIRLPYNIKVSEKYDPDVVFAEYIGREHPVSYYGTQRGESATWSTDIDKTDKEMIYALRRLAAWRGDVYVREPSGTGYWANIKVTAPQDYSGLVIPVSLEITRVEGDK